MKIAVTGEGPTDYGRCEYINGNRQWVWGPIAVYLEKIAAINGVNIELIPIEKKRVMEHHLQKRSLKGLEGMAIPARKFSELMKSDKCQYGIFYCDADREAGTKNSSEVQARKQFQKRYEEVKIGLESASYEKIPMIPLRMIENWIISDQNAIEVAYNKRYEKNVVPAKCELLWGDKNDPNSNYPKHFLLRMIRGLDKKYAKEILNAETFVDIASVQDFNLVRKNCNISFEQFYQDYENMLKLNQQNTE